MNFIHITEEELRVEEVTSKVTDTCTGATSLFVGTTRDNFEGKKVVRLEYEAYTPMAEKKMEELCNRLRVKWSDLHHIAMYHRLGCVDPCQASVIIGISSAHRQSSLEAVHFAIDELKATVPIWKKEMYEDGSQWKENKECFWTNKSEPAGFAGQVDPSLVQIHCDNEELDRRIENFIDVKREELNRGNVLEFCGQSASSCARTDAVLVSKRDSKSHLRKSVVANQVGPNMTRVLDERLATVEEFMGDNKPVPRDVYARLKAIEDRLVLLERRQPAPPEMIYEEATYANARKAALTESLITINKEIAQLKNQLLSQQE